MSIIPMTTKVNRHPKDDNRFHIVVAPGLYLKLSIKRLSISIYY